VKVRPLSVCIAGATGWAGRALVPAVLGAPDLELVSAVGRSAAGRDLGQALGGAALGVQVHGAVHDALEGVDLLVDYTSATAVKANTLAAIDAGAAVVVGSSGLWPGTSRRSTPRRVRVESVWSRPGTSQSRRRCARRRPS
jgi:4-hydroxy-tetrahydrodipicolinate reductase